MDRKVVPALVAFTGFIVIFIALLLILKRIAV